MPANHIFIEVAFIVPNGNDTVLKIPTALPGVDPKILDPRDTYKNAKDWDVKAEDLANRFVKNFVKFTGNEEGKKLVAAGPKVK